MKLTVTTFSNRKDAVFVENHEKKEFSIEFKEKTYTFKPAEKLLTPVGLVQSFIWDFLNPNQYQETRRRRMMGTIGYEVALEKALYVYEKPKNTEEIDEKKQAEPTFQALKELNDETCKALTKSGKRCKNEAVVDGFCKVHTPKED